MKPFPKTSGEKYAGDEPEERDAGRDHLTAFGDNPLEWQKAAYTRPTGRLIRRE